VLANAKFETEMNADQRNLYFFLMILNKILKILDYLNIFSFFPSVNDLRRRVFIDIVAHFQRIAPSEEEATLVYELVSTGACCCVGGTYDHNLKLIKFKFP
jgi:hypothetical protein